MTTNFESMSLNLKTGSRIGIGDGDSSCGDNGLTQQQHHITDRIDFPWPPLATSSSNNNELSSLPPAQDVVIQQRQQQFFPKRGKQKFTNDPGRLLLPSGRGNESRDNQFASLYAAHATNENNRIVGNGIPLPENCNDSQEHFPSPNSVIDIKKTITKPIETKTQVDTWSTNQTEAQSQHQHQQHQLTIEQFNQLQHQLQQQQFQHGQTQNQQQHQQQNRHPQRDNDFACLHPRDDQRSRVRFSPSLSVYDNFEDFDYNDDAHENSLEINDIESDCKLFLIRRARHLWYSKEELKKIKSQRKEIVRALKKVKFDVRAIDKSVYELRGLEAYLSPQIIGTTQRKRREALESVLNEQLRQRKSPSGKRNVQRLQLVSFRASEWFRTRALEFAERDAIEARHFLNHPEVVRLMAFCKNRREKNPRRTTECFLELEGTTTEQNLSSLRDVFHESFTSVMDLDDDGAGDAGNNSTLSFWANSSWTRDLMDE